MIKSRRRLTGHVAHMLEKTDTYRVLVEKPERKRQLGGHRHRWEDNIRVGYREIEWGGTDQINPAQEHGNKPSDSMRQSDWWPVRKFSSPWSYLS
jgi:hypothetical protein